MKEEDFTVQEAELGTQARKEWTQAAAAAFVAMRLANIHIQDSKSATDNVQEK